jgi:methionyl-tRNA synthetase
VAILGNFVNRTLILTNNYFSGEVPDPGIKNDNDNEVLAEILKIKKNVESNLDNFRFREALKEAMNLARLGNKYLADTEPWKIIKNDVKRVGTILNIALQITANLTIVLEPFLPFSMEKLRGWLNYNGVKWDDAGRTDLIKAGHLINKPELLFDKIEDDAINRQVEKLMRTKTDNEVTEIQVIPQKDPVSFDDFTMLDIRTATILEAEKVPKTNKLLKLKIDCGIDIRTIVSGIAEYFDPESLPGKQISIIANLEPRKIKGIESKGMILMAEDSEGKLVIITPEEKIGNGSIIK